MRFAALLLASLASACSAAEPADSDAVTAAQAAQSSSDAALRDDGQPGGPVPGQTGVPAPRLPTDAPPAAETTIISKVELSEQFNRPGKVGCYITFAYRGFTPEDVISDSPCEELTVLFVDQAFLERQNDWDRLDSFQKASVSKLPDGKVLYVEGEFAAAIYPIGYTGTTEEIWVSD